LASIREVEQAGMLDPEFRSFLAFGTVQDALSLELFDLRINAGAKIVEMRAYLVSIVRHAGTSFDAVVHTAIGDPTRGAKV
jgi:hypothetical protein